MSRNVDNYYGAVGTYRDSKLDEYFATIASAIISKSFDTIALSYRAVETWLYYHSDWATTDPKGNQTIFTVKNRSPFMFTYFTFFYLLLKIDDVAFVWLQTITSSFQVAWNQSVIENWKGITSMMCLCVQWKVCCGEDLWR